MRKRWRFREYLYDPLSISMKYSISLPLARVLSSREIGEDKVESFLNPSLEHLNSPYLFADMEKAVGRIKRAIDDGEAIMIHGDYDVDGVSALALLYRNLERLGAGKIIPYIPDRFNEGYGLSEKGVREAIEKGVGLIITVDCGVTAVDEIKLAREAGIDVIVTDHHEAQEVLPPAFALINPKVGDYPFQELAGVGVAYKLMEALYEKLNLDKKPLYWDLDLVALGTVADVVPLVDENRVLVKFGLIVLNDTLKAGLKALKATAHLNGEIFPWHISFIIAPRLNAAGRLSHAEKAFRLLVTKSGEEALAIARELEDENRKRQNIEKQILEEAREMAEKLDLDENWVLVLGKRDWHEGVIGIVASKLTEMYHRPTLLISLGEDMGKGSARSIPSFHLYNALKEAEDILIGFGGHKYAAGFRIGIDRIGALREVMNNVAKRELNEEDLIPEIYIDSKIEISEITGEFLKDYEKLAPFGLGNPLPVFLLEEVEVVGEIEKVGDNHLRFTVRKGKDFLGVFAPGHAEFVNRLERGKSLIDLVFQLVRNNRSPRAEYELKALDIRIKR